MNKLEFDLSALSDLSPEKFESKNDRLGFYKKDNNTCVLTTRKACNRTDFIDKIDRIAKVLEKTAISTEQESNLSAEHSIKIIQYIDCVYRIIGRHNDKIEKTIHKTWVKYLAKLPLIGRLVRWIFNSITRPDPFLNRFFIVETQKVRDYLSPSQDLDALVHRKDALIRMVAEQEENQSHMKGTGHSGWDKSREIIQSEYISLLKSIVPELKLSQEILTSSSVTDGRAILKLSAEDPVVKAYEQCTGLLKRLQWDGAIEDYMTDEARELSSQAKHLALDAYRSIILAGQPVRSYLAASNDFEQLKQRHKDLQEKTGELRTAHNRLGTDQSKTWGRAQEIIQHTFEDLINDIVPSVKLARKLQGTICQDSQKTYRELLGLADQEETAKAPEICNAILKQLKVDSGLNNFLTEDQKKCCEEAKALAIKAYAQWHVQRICRVGQKGKKTTDITVLASLLGTDDLTQFAKKYQSLTDRVKTLDTPDAQEAHQILRSHYFDHLDAPYRSLKNALNEQNPLFKEITSVQALLTAYRGHFQVLENRQQFGMTASSPDRMGQEVAELKKILLDAYHKHLAFLVPIFGEATTILNIHRGPSDSDLECKRLTLVTESSPNQPLQSEKWYIHKISLFNFDLAQMEEKDFPPEIWRILQDAKEKLRADLSSLREKQMIESLKEEQKPPSYIEDLFGGLVKFFTGEDKGQEQPLKLYREKLMKLLETTEIKEQAALERKYKQKKAEITSLPKSESMQALLDNTYANYLRALKIQPLLAKIASSWSNPRLTVEDLFTKNPPENPLEIETQVNMFLELLEQETAIAGTQQKHPLLSTLENAKSCVSDCWENYLLKRYPQYKIIKQIQMKITSDDPVMIYSSIIGCNTNASYEKACKIHEDLLASIKITGDNQPLAIQAAYMDAAKWVILAYKEWEADRILSLPAKAAKVLIYGVSVFATFQDQKKRWRTLKLMLHSDKTIVATPKLSEKLVEAGKRVPDVEDKY